MRLSALRASLGDEWDDINQQAYIKCLPYINNKGYLKIYQAALHSLALDRLKQRNFELRTFTPLDDISEAEEPYTETDMETSTEIRVALQRFTKQEQEWIMGWVTGKMTLVDISNAIRGRSGSHHMYGERFITRALTQLREDIKSHDKGTTNTGR